MALKYMVSTTTFEQLTIAYVQPWKSKCSSRRSSTTLLLIRVQSAQSSFKLENDVVD